MLKAIVSLCNSGTAESVRFNDVSTWQQVFLQDMKEKNLQDLQNWHAEWKQSSYFVSFSWQKPQTIS